MGSTHLVHAEKTLMTVSSWTVESSPSWNEQGRCCKRPLLTWCRTTQLKAYEQARTSAEHTYSKSKALALQRLNSRNSQLLRSSVTGALPAAPQAGSATATAAPPTPEQTDDRAPFPDDGRHFNPGCL